MIFKNIGLYVRVSTDIQVDGYSIDEQLERLQKYADAHEWTVYDKYIDPGFSGSNIDRPAMCKMLKDVREHKLDLVLVYKLDRLSRSQKDTLYLIEEEFIPNKVEFISMTENFDTSSPFGKAMIGILSVFAQLERENIKQRLALGRIGRAKAGYWRAGSNPPIGYDYINGLLQINEYEALQVRKIYELFLKGESIYGITNYMNANYTNRYSSYKDSSQTGVILKNRLYIGKIKCGSEEYEGVHDSIIDEDTFNRVQKRYKEISNKWGEYYRSPYKGKQLLTGLIFCDNCGARYFSISCTSKKHGKYSYYKCYSRDGNSSMKKMDGCKNPTYKVEDLDNAILSEIKKLKLDPNYLDQLIKNKKTRPEDNTLKVLKNRLQEINSKINKLMDLYTIGSIPLSDIGDRTKPLYDEKSKIESQIEEYRPDEEPDVLSIKDTNEILDKYLDRIDNADHDTKRELIQALIKKIVIGKEKDHIKIYWKFQ